MKNARDAREALWQAPKTANASMQTEKIKMKDSFVQAGAGAAYSGTVNSVVEVRGMTIGVSMRTMDSIMTDPGIQVEFETSIQAVQRKGTPADAGTQKIKTQDSGVQTGVTTADAGTQTIDLVPAKITTTTLAVEIHVRASTTDADVQAKATTANSCTQPRKA